jgi:N-methylhydantoinase A
VHFAGAGFVACPIYDRDLLPEGAAIAGPAIIEQMDTTTVLFPSQRIDRDAMGNLIMRFS